MSWGSKKQVSVALSTCEAEIMAASEAAKEALYLCKLMAEFRHAEPETVTIFEDNTAAELIKCGPEMRLTMPNPATHGVVSFL